MPDDRFLHRRAGHGSKVNLLTDLEYRVWTQYMLSADDFGVMRASAVTLQADNDHLANRPAKVVQRALEVVIKSGLVREFEHQKRRYIYQHDWQFWQKVAYPRTTTNPPPSAEALTGCDDSTRRLFSIHPGGAGRKRVEFSENVPRTDAERSENIQRTDQECSPLMRADAPAKRLMANGQRLTADGSEGSPRETEPPDPRLPQWLDTLYAEYPQHRVTRGFMTSSSFHEQITAGPEPQIARWTLMRANLDNQKRGHQWTNNHNMVPKLERWLRDGLWRQQHPSEAPVSEQLAPRVNRTLAAAANIMKGRS